MRVALVYPQLSLEGSHDRQCVLLAQGLATLGIDVHVYCDPRARTVELPGITCHDVRASLTGREGRVTEPFNILSFAAGATRALRRDRSHYDLIHVWGCSAWEHDVVSVTGVVKADQRRWPERAGRTYRAARMRGRLAQLHRPRGTVLRWIQQQQLRSGEFARLIAQTDEARRDLEELFSIPGKQISVIPPAITIAPADKPPDTSVRVSLGIPSDTPILLFVGHAFERKGLHEAIEALHGLDPEAHLVVIGSGDRAGFVHFAESLGVAGRVHFVGGTTTPERFYPEADLLVHPARQESWGVIVFEAMAFGVPVVTTWGTGSAGEVASSGSGVVLEDGSPSSLRREVSKLLRDSQRRSQMAERGRTTARRFRPERIAQATLDVYRRAAKERAA